jgi:hypothetical protein
MTDERMAVELDHLFGRGKRRGYAVHPTPTVGPGAKHPLVPGGDVTPEHSMYSLEEAHRALELLAAVLRASIENPADRLLSWSVPNEKALRNRLTQIEEAIAEVATASS